MAAGEEEFTPAVEDEDEVGAVAAAGPLVAGAAGDGAQNAVAVVDVDEALGHGAQCVGRGGGGQARDRSGNEHFSRRPLPVINYKL
jgi:hypothetical protein